MSNSSPQFDHEKLDVYHVAIKFVGWVAELAASLDPSAKFPRDQLLRSSQSIPQNIVEGNGKRTGPERRRYFEIARGSATESAATIDILVAIGACERGRVDEGKQLAKRLVQMLTKLAPPEPSTRTRTRTTELKRHPVFRAGRRFPSGGRRAG